MISITTAQRVLEIGGGAILHWASAVQDERVTAHMVAKAKEAGAPLPGAVDDLLALSFEAGGIRHRLTPMSLIDRLGPDYDVSPEPTEDEADVAIQKAVYGEVLFGEQRMTSAERLELDQALGTLREDDGA